MKYTTILFDLDGTLTDSSEGLVNSLQYAMKQYGMEPWAPEALHCFIGPPLLDTCRDVLHMTPEEGQKFLHLFRHYFDDCGWRENQLFHGVPEMLKALKDAGATLVLATSKPEVFAVRIMEYFHVAQYFTVMAGSDMDETRSLKADVIAYALEQLPDTELSKTVMVGDRKHDIVGGQAHNLDTIGLLEGFGGRSELEIAGATHIVDTIADLQSYLLT
ncbi:MAG: HAD hydrolase-like protein [Eubacteriales bacterium]